MPPRPGPILVVNAGSSSIKFSLFDVADGRELRLDSKGQLDGIGTQPRLRVRDAPGVVLADDKLPPSDVLDVPAAMTRVGAWLSDRLRGTLPMAVGHRVVHGGPEYATPVRVTGDVLAALERLVPLAPLHQPVNLGPIRMIQAPLRPPVWPRHGAAPR